MKYADLIERVCRTPLHLRTVTLMSDSEYKVTVRSNPPDFVRFARFSM